MSSRIRVADGLAKLSAEQLATMAGGVITGLTNNSSFPAPTVDLKTVQAAIDDLNAAVVAQPCGGPPATAEKRNKQEALITLLRRLKHYVEDNCGNDLAVLLSSGFQAAATMRNRGPLANPSILHITPGNGSELVLKVSAVQNARSYHVRTAPIGSDNAPGAWQLAGIFTNSRAMRVTGLVPGTTYAFQVRAVGGTTGYSDWSNMVSRMCA